MSRPRLSGRLGTARVSVVAAPPGSGKTVMLRSWISQSDLQERAAWVPAGRGERDPQQFWLSVLAALRQTAAGSALVQAVTAAPDLDGWVITERLRIWRRWMTRCGWWSTTCTSSAPTRCGSWSC